MAEMKQTEEERILELFQNRAELKKEFNDLQKAHLLLSKTSEEQAKKIDGLESDLKHLERHLMETANYADTQVYYQLRKLWETCHIKINKLRDRLVDQRRDRDRKQQLMEFNQKRAKNLNIINDEISKAKKFLDSIIARVEDLTKSIDAKNMPWHFFARQRLGTQRAQALKTQTEAYSELHIKEESEPWPEFEGLEIEAKRQINLALIGLAQYYFSATTELGLGLKAYDSKNKRVWNRKYGTEAQRKTVLVKIMQKLEQFSKAKDLGAEVKTRVAKLNESVEFKTATATIPTEDSVPNVMNDLTNINMQATMTDVPTEINVVKHNYWDIVDLLIPEGKS